MDPKPTASSHHAWKIAAVSVCGSSHLRIGTPCQDAHAFRELPAGMMVAAVSDGAGSAPLSETGSRLAVEAAVATLAERLEGAASPMNDDALREALDQAWRAALTAIEREARRREEPVRSFAATLIAFASSPDWTAVVQIGDGASLVRDRAGELIALTVPKPGEYVNETTFLTSPEAEPVAQTVIWRSAIAQVCAFTDGIQALALKLPEAAPHPPFFRPLFNLMEGASAQEAEMQIAAFLQSDRIRKRADDDLTLLLAHLQ